MTPRAVILAAGASRRMGRPKACVLWRGRSFVEHCVTLAQTVGCSDIVVVAGAHPIAAAYVPDARVIEHRHWERGPRSSLRAGLLAVLEGVVADISVLVLTVDRPHIQSATVRTLVEASARDPSVVWQPSCDTRRGHPLMLPWALVQQLAQDAGHDPLRAVLSGPPWASRRRSVGVEDRAIHDNIDTPEDLRRIVQADHAVA